MYVSMYVKKNLKLIFHIKIFFYRAFDDVDLKKMFEWRGLGM